MCVYCFNILCSYQPIDVCIFFITLCDYLLTDVYILCQYFDVVVI